MSAGHVGNHVASMGVPIGRRLYDALGPDGDRTYTDEDRQLISGLIQEVCSLIDSWRAEHKLVKVIEERCLVDGLFSTHDKLDDRKKAQLMTQCMLECLRWSVAVIEKQKFVPQQMLRNFVLDVAWLGIFGEQFGMLGSGRSHEWIPEDAYGDACRWYCFGTVPGRLTSEFMSIFELRQAMETRFRRLLGIKDITRGVKISHGMIPNIIQRSISDKNFHPASGMTLIQIRHVYDWTDVSIHLMRTDFVWLVWKAFQVCGGMFSSAPRANGMMSIHDSFEFSEDLLEKMRTEFVQEVRSANSSIKSFSIAWGEPDAAIVDSHGRWMKVKPRVEIVDANA